MGFIPMAMRYTSDNSDSFEYFSTTRRLAIAAIRMTFGKSGALWTFLSHSSRRMSIGITLWTSGTLAHEKRAVISSKIWRCVILSISFRVICYETYHKYLSQVSGEHPLPFSQCVFFECQVGCNELKDLSLEHHVRLEGGEVTVPPFWNSLNKCSTLGAVQVD